MSTQFERKTDTRTTTITAGELQGSDYFPPGTGWNKAPREVRDLDLEKRIEDKTNHDSHH